MRRIAILGPALLIAFGALVAACGTSETQEDAPIEIQTETSQPGRFPATKLFFWPPPQVTVSREQAIGIGFDKCIGAGPEVTGVENPHDPVARLMPIGEYEDRTGSRSPAHDSHQHVWVVQFEGESFGAGISALPGREPSHYRFAGCVVDAQNGSITGVFRNPVEPLLLPSAMLNRVPSGISDVNLGTAVETHGLVDYSRAAAIALAQERYGSVRSGGYYRPERAEAELVLYTGICHKSVGQVPAPTPTPGGPPSTPPPLRGSCGVEWGSEDSSNRLTWIVVIPVELSLEPCGGKPGIHAACWSQPVFALIDAETGKEYGGGSTGGFIGPIVTNNDEYRALTRFAWAEGWWELWHRVRSYAGKQLPEGYAQSLDRPDAPTPTPRPEPIAPSDAIPIPTPTPPPLPTKTAVAPPTVRPTATINPLPTRMAALLIGSVVERDGCLAVASKNEPESHALVWSEGQYAVERSSSTVEITDLYRGGATVVWQLGQEVRLSGGISSPPTQEHRQFTVGKCTAGPYFLVGGVE